MKLSDFDFELPKELIAQEHAQPRDHSRLLVLDKDTGSIEHKHFFDLIDYLHAGDVLVVNDSKVFPARLIGKKATGGRMEVFLHKQTDRSVWECIIGGRGAKPGLEVFIGDKVVASLISDNGDGTWLVSFNISGVDFFNEIEKVGIMPLPPYIKRDDEGDNDDKDNYQTVYARNVGSVAAPTAGLHFTDELLKKITDKGIPVARVTLHVGMGTFAPVKTDDILEHKMHSEYAEVSLDELEKIRQAKSGGGRVIAVGTTSVRVLETVVADLLDRKTKELSRSVDIFIYPGYEFRIVDALVTNFHLPKSTLLMLVSALAGKSNIDEAYRQAVVRGYRFFSYGDAMLIR